MFLLCNHRILTSLSCLRGVFRSGPLLWRPHNMKSNHMYNAGVRIHFILVDNMGDLFIFQFGNVRKFYDAIIEGRRDSLKKKNVEKNK